MIKYCLLVIELLCFVHSFEQLPALSKRIEKVDINSSSYSDFRKQACADKGLFPVYIRDNKYYFEIPDSLLGRDFLLVSRIARSATGTKLYGGDETANMIIRFERKSDNRLLLRKVSFLSYEKESTSAVYEAISRSNFMPVIATFNTEPFPGAAMSSIINVTDFLNGDNEGVNINVNQKSTNFLGALSADKSYISDIRSFPANLEVVSVKTYFKSGSSGERQESRATATGVSSFEINTSIVLLPENKMQLRFSDARVGFFSLNQKDFEANVAGVQNRSYIKKWRLEPFPEDWDKYVRGELVNPQKPIVFYIDPATPPQWVPYLIQGVNDWQQAFECAGFKNAISAKIAPTHNEDSTWSLYDARHSAIIYKPSEIENANGPSIADPRTGEILESHIGLYHNITKLIHDWYMVQCGGTDARARKMIFDDSLLGTLIRGVISHEVGHTLGLRHNMGASSSVPVDSLRNKKWVEENGFCPSIMDYARFNYVAQPSDGVGESGLLPRIGPYDKWAIEWGYRLYPQFRTPEDELRFMDSLIIRKNRERKFWFGAENNVGDPRIQSEDLGDNAIQAAQLGINNLKRIVPDLVKWTRLDNDGYNSLNDIFNVVKNQYVTYISHVISYIGGIYENLKSNTEKGPIYQPVPISIQKEAVAFLSSNFFNTPEWLADTSVLNRIGQTSLGVIGEVQDRLLRKLLYPPILLFGMLSRNESSFGLEKTYTAVSFLQDLKNSVWEELFSHSKIDMYRRSLQKQYVTYMLDAYKEGKKNVGVPLIFSGITSLYGMDAASMIYGHLKELRIAIKVNLTLIKDEASRFHLQYLYNQIGQIDVVRDPF